MDKMREEFEAWHRDNVFISHPENTRFYMYDEHLYLDPSVQDCWKTWKASRAALCVEFPEQPKRIFAFDDGAFQVVKQLESRGIDVKNKPNWVIKMLESDKNKPLS